MWTRLELKKNAKEQMKGRYWNYLGASLMPQLASYVISIPISVISQIIMLPMFIGTGIAFENSGLLNELNNFDATGNIDIEAFTQFYLSVLSVLAIPIMIISLITFLSVIFIMQPITVGMNRWFIRSGEDKNVSLSMCFGVFKKGSYLKTVGAMAYSMFFLFLWKCLFVIPGIIKYYAYRMIPYIIADNPNIGAKRALKLSSMMTRGHKFNIFVLDISFIGWYFLGFLACCIGVYAVIPYVYATNAELYDELKKKAVDDGVCTMEELGYIMVASEAVMDS